MTEFGEKFYGIVDSVKDDTTTRILGDAMCCSMINGKYTVDKFQSRTVIRTKEWAVVNWHSSGETQFSGITYDEFMAL